jgi:hypothetical protein
VVENNTAVVVWEKGRGARSRVIRVEEQVSGAGCLRL